MLLGLGPGLTPSGDDIVAGALCALRLLGGEKTFTAALADHVTGAALTRTTALSATLLRLAAQGDVAAEVGRVFMGITGHACLDEPARRLLEIGHTSGADLAAGLLAGGAAALEHAR
jgi:hypothetical protein